MNIERVSGKNYEADEMHLMQRRIQHLERINDSLRKDLKYLRSGLDKKSGTEQTDVSI